MKIVRSFFLVLLSVIVVSCGGSNNSTNNQSTFRPVVEVSLSPASVTIKTNDIGIFKAEVEGIDNKQVNWVFDGGAILEGVLQSPSTPGTYRVTAISRADPSKKASAVVNVIAREQSLVRFFHASVDAPRLNFLLTSSQSRILDHHESSGFLNVDEGDYYFGIAGQVPNRSAIELIPTLLLNLVPNAAYDVIAVNTANKMEPLIISDTGKFSDTTKVRVRVAHLAPAASEVKVFVTAPTADLATATPLGSFSFKGVLGPVEVPAGTYRIRVTLPNNTVVFDSGSVALTSGKDLLIGAVSNVGNGSSPIQLAVLDGANVAVLSDATAGAKLRVIHASADALAVDVLANNGVTPAVANLAFPAFTNYLNLPAATYNFKVVPTGVTTPVVLNKDVALANGMEYSFLAVGALANLSELILVDNNRKVATEAKVRLVHASTLANNVDIYVVAAGASIANASPAFRNVPFKADTGYVSLLAGNYDVIITPTGTKTQAIKATLSFANGMVYTAVARDGINLTTPLSVIGLDGLAP